MLFALGGLAVVGGLILVSRRRKGAGPDAAGEEIGEGSYKGARDYADSTKAFLKAEGKRVALATVVSTWGSSPRPVGSQLVVDETGAMQGSVSGGCIEGAVVEEALAAIKDGEPRLLEFGVSDDQAWAVGLACGGQIEVLIEPLPAEKRS